MLAGKVVKHMQLDHWIGEKIKQWQKCEENVGYLIYNYSPKASIKRAIFAKDYN